MIKSSLLTLVCLCLLAFTSAIYAQGKLQFEKDTHDFGKVAQGVPAGYVFKFKNIGDQPIVIANVQASCGCTTPDWTKTPVLPGKSGIVKAEYNAAGLGAFNKSVTVTSNAVETSQVLFIKGTVVDKAEIKAFYTPEEKAKSSKINLNKTFHDFGKLESGQRGVVKFLVKNTGKQDLTINSITSNSNAVSFGSLPQNIKPNSEQTVELTYTPRVLGEQTEVVTIATNDINTPTVSVKLKAKVVQSLSAQSVLKENSAAVPFK